MSRRLPIADRTDYAAYLQSPQWRQTREQALWRAQRRCQDPNCDLACMRSLTDREVAEETMEWSVRYKLEVHHLTYERLGHEDQDDLIVLCEACHRRQHGIVDAVTDPESSGPRPLGEVMVTVFNNMIRGMAETADVNA